MNRPADSRIYLAAVTTALLVGMAWILTEIAVIPAVDESPVWRYTRMGWTETSELAVPRSLDLAGPVDHVSPWVVAGLELLTGLMILIGFVKPADRTPTPRRRRDDCPLSSAPRAAIR